jgi:NADPH:quinone reductase-like Zn-dependent oxidoreductase
VLITAASSSAGLAAIDTVKAEQAIAIATTRKRDKRDELLAAGADHVIVTEEEDLVARVKAITNGAGARLIFDPIAGPLLEKLAEAAAQGAMIIEYGWLSLTPTPFPVVPALTKVLNICRLLAYGVVSPRLRFVLMWIRMALVHKSCQGQGGAAGFQDQTRWETGIPHWVIRLIAEQASRASVFCAVSVRARSVGPIRVL